LFLPFNYKIVEKRELIVVDGNGVPINNASVRQFWHQYSLGYKGGDDLITDINGLVILPARMVRTTIFDILYGTFSTIIEYKIHASLGSSDSVFISAKGHGSKWYYDGKGLESKIVVLN
jgi:hypothetical protein